MQGLNHQLKIRESLLMPIEQTHIFAKKEAACFFIAGKTHLNKNI